jgi:hypothetical protein
MLALKNVPHVIQHFAGGISVIVVDGVAFMFDDAGALASVAPLGREQPKVLAVDELTAWRTPGWLTIVRGGATS